GDHEYLPRRRQRRSGGRGRRARDGHGRRARARARRASLGWGGDLRRDPYRIGIRPVHHDDRFPGGLQRKPRRHHRQRDQLPLLGRAWCSDLRGRADAACGRAAGLASAHAHAARPAPARAGAGGSRRRHSGELSRPDRDDPNALMKSSNQHQEASMEGSRSRRRNHHRAGALSVLLVAALSIALAACGSSKSKSSSSAASPPAPAASGPGVGKPAVTLGDKNFSEENILGALYAQALRAKGYKVTLKDNVGSTEIIYKALTAGQIDLYPEYTGVFLSAIAGQTRNPPSATAAYSQAKAFVEKHGLTLLKTTPFFDSNVLATLPSYASKHGLKSI